MRPSRLFPPLRFLNAPNLATSAGAVAGLLAMLRARPGGSQLSLACLFAAIGFDHLDGVLARRLGRVTDFGRELDSLADLVSFCVAPAFWLHAAGMTSPPEIALLVVYCLAGAWRLAYYNIT